MEYPSAIDFEKVGSYPALTKVGGGYFFDHVLEYRVWIHPEAGGKDLFDGDDYFYCFATFTEAKEFSENTAGAETPLVLVYQKEYINEPSSGVYEHILEERITEWQPEWLDEKHTRSENSIHNFLRERSKL